MNSVIRLTKKDTDKILSVMVLYNRTDGYIAFVDAKLMFFDSKPSFGGTYVTLEQMKNTQFISYCKKEINEPI